MSEALWFDICPCCEGTGKLTTQKGNRRGKSAITDIGAGVESTKCEACEGRGQVLICKKIRKSK